MNGRVLVHCKMGISRFGIGIRSTFIIIRIVLIFLIRTKLLFLRSASTVCSFAMKYFGWSLERALSHTKVSQGANPPTPLQDRRAQVNPNSGFRQQLQIYEGILEASRQRDNFRKIQRSKSEGSMKKTPVPLRKGRSGRERARLGSSGEEGRRAVGENWACGLITTKNF